MRRLALQLSLVALAGLLTVVAGACGGEPEAPENVTVKTVSLDAPAEARPSSVRRSVPGTL
jgi:hypothetical protein